MQHLRKQLAFMHIFMNRKNHFFPHWTRNEIQFLWAMACWFYDDHYHWHVRVCVSALSIFKATTFELITTKFILNIHRLNEQNNAIQTTAHSLNLSKYFFKTDYRGMEIGRDHFPSIAKQTGRDFFWISIKNWYFFFLFPFVI